MTAKTPARPVLSEKVRAIPASGIRKFFDIAATMKDVISLGIGEPDFTAPDLVVEAARSSLARGETHYTSNYGLLELRREIGKLLARLYELDYAPDREIIVTTGVSEGLNLALHGIIDPGDEVLIPDPSYVAYPPNVILAGGTPVLVPTDRAHDFRVTALALERAITPRTRAMLLGYPNNPTGAEMTREDLLPIAQLAVARDLLVVSDEIYDRLVYGVTHTSLAGLPGMRERTILLGGVSKAYAMTGFRIGWLCAPSAMLEGIMKVHQYVMMSAPTSSQFAAVAALAEGEPAVATMVAEYDRRRRLLVDGFNRLGLDCFEPRGAFYTFPDVRSSGLDDDVFATRLLQEEGVAVVPGSAFGPSGRGHVRACYATEYTRIEEALRRIERFLIRCKGKAA
jgi:aminotransferase